jgi:hypothetical protein
MMRGLTRMPEWPGNGAKEQGHLLRQGKLECCNREAACNAKSQSECLFEDMERHAHTHVLTCIHLHMELSM